MKKRFKNITFDFYDYNKFSDDKTKLVNSNFFEIHEKGYFLEIRQNRNNYNTLYLVDKTGVRVSSGLKFRSNSIIRKGVPVFTKKELHAKYFCYAKVNTHKDKAMKKLIDYIDNDFKVAEQHEELLTIINYFIKEVVNSEWTEDSKLNIKFRDKILNEIKLNMNDYAMNTYSTYKKSINSLRKIVKNISNILTRTKNVDFDEIEDDLEDIKRLLVKMKKQANKIIDEKNGTFVKDLEKVIGKTEKRIIGIKQSMYI